MRRRAIRAPSGPSAVPVKLDMTDHASVPAAAEQAEDVKLLINCAGIATHGVNAVDGDFEVFRRPG